MNPVQQKISIALLNTITKKSSRKILSLVRKQHENSDRKRIVTDTLFIRFTVKNKHCESAASRIIKNMSDADKTKQINFKCWLQVKKLLA